MPTVLVARLYRWRKSCGKTPFLGLCNSPPTGLSDSRCTKPALSSSGRTEGAGAFRPLNTASISMAFRPGLYGLRIDFVFVWLNLHFCFFLVPHRCCRPAEHETLCPPQPLANLPTCDSRAAGANSLHWIKNPPTFTFED